MASNRFRAGIAGRAALLVVTSLLLAFVVARTDWYVSMALLFAAVAVEAATLVHFATSWSREVARFLDAVAFEDASASFAGLSSDSVFRELGLAMGRVMETLRRGRAEREEQAHYLKALINHVPVALLAVDEDGKVNLLNFAARRLFEGAATNVADFPRYGPAFAAGLEQLKPGEGVLLRMERRSGALQLKAAATDLALADRRRRLI
ncbi:MAG: hypothetical protein ACREFW_07020, partial [Rhizomicrobium sp.]